jgi:hypothetical protein
LSFIDSFIQHYTIYTASLITGIYVLAAIFKSKFQEGTFIQIVAVFLYTASFISGLKLSIDTFHNNMNVQNFEDSTFAYTILGGFAVAWIAMWEVIKRFKDLG